MKTSIFKPSLLLKTKQKYKGNKKTIPILFEIYRVLVETAYKSSMIHLYQDIPSHFDTIVLDLRKHLDLEPQDITRIKTRIEALIEEMNANEPEYGVMDKKDVINIHLKPQYLKAVQELKDLLQKLFDSLDINTKIVKVLSDSTGILVPTFVTDLTPSEQFIEEQISLASAIKDKIFQKYEETLKKQKVKLKESEEDSDLFALTKDNNVIGYIHKSISDPNTTFKLFSNISDIETHLQKKQLIDNVYDKLTLGKEGKLYTPNGDLVTTIDFIPESMLPAQIKKYNTLIEQHKSSFSSSPYEITLNNDPKTIQLGDHNLKVVKAIDKNVIRPVIIEGPYKGIFLDQLVSASGKVLGSSSVASPYFMENKQVLESTGVGKLRVKDVFKMEQSVVSSLLKDYVPKNDPLETGVLVYLEGLGNRTWTTMKDLKKAIMGRSYTSKIIPSNLCKMVGLSIIKDLGGNTEFVTVRNVDSTERGREGIKTSIRKARAPGERENLIELDRTLFFKDGKPHEISNDLFIAPSCAPDGLGLRVFSQQVKAAVESKFSIITTEAARSENFFVGYYVWPKLGYNGVIPHLARFFGDTYKNRDGNTKYYRDYNDAASDLKKNTEPQDPDSYENIHRKAVPLFKWLDERNLLKRITIKGHTFYEANILDIYACKIGDKFLGQDLWKEFGDGVDLEFDLSEGSLSRRILDSYVTLKAQKDGIPVEEFLNVDYEKYSNIKSFTCLVDKYMKDPYDYSAAIIGNKIPEALRFAIKNKENGELLDFLNKTNIVEILEELYNRDVLKDSDIMELKSIINEYNIKLPSNTLKLASNKNEKKPKQNDAVFRGLDMGILDKIWDEISKIYG